MPRPPGPVTRTTPGSTSARWYSACPASGRLHLAVDPGPAALDPGEGHAEQRLGPPAQVVVGVLVQVERERLGVLVRVADGQPAAGPLDQQQLGAGLRRGPFLRWQPVPSGQVEGGVVAQRVAVGQRRGDPIGQRRRLHHLQPDPPDRRLP